MHTPTLIIGGGLSGLSLAYQLQKAGRAFLLVEARDRLGGRIKSLTIEQTAFDLGPSWVWPGQHRVAQLIDELELSLFSQWSDGTQLFEQPSGEVRRNAGFMSMAGSMRVSGGTSELTDGLAAKLDASKVLTKTQVASIDQNTGATLSNGVKVTADQIVLCVPPRLAAQLIYAPALPEEAVAALSAVPTWMGAHAKFVAVYETPFWRDAGLSGDASSRRGPLAEIHDASPRDTGLGALFGFVGLPAEARGQIGDTLEQACIDQLTNLFGVEAGQPIAVGLEDWSKEPLTAAHADATPPPGHPPYNMLPELMGLWDDQLIFAVTELSPDNGGLIEGALAAAEYAAKVILAN